MQQIISVTLVLSEQFLCSTLINHTTNGDTGFFTTVIIVMFQAKIQSGEREEELRFKLACSKVKKKYDADPVLEAKDYSYLQEMLCGAIEQTE